MRISFHPDQYTILNSTRKEVLTSTIKSLEYHYNLLDMLSIQEKLILLHIGSSTFGKENSMTRFANQFYALDEKLRKCIAIENDDKLFNVIDTLSLCQKLNTPMVLDYHHHICNGGFSVFPYIEEIFRTWKNQIPKVHFSSPKSKLKKEFRSHHDYIDSDTFIFFIEQIKHLPYDIDIMIAKIKGIFQRRYALDVIADGDLQLKKGDRAALLRGEELELTTKEFDLLLLLMENKGKVLHKEYIFNQVWGLDSCSEPQTLTVHIKWLRQKIEVDPKHPKRIITVWGVGYQFV